MFLGRRVPVQYSFAHAATNEQEDFALHEHTSSPPIKYWMNTYFFSGGFAVKCVL